MSTMSKLKGPFIVILISSVASFAVLTWAQIAFISLWFQHSLDKKCYASENTMKVQGCMFHGFNVDSIVNLECLIFLMPIVGIFAAPIIVGLVSMIGSLIFTLIFSALLVIGTLGAKRAPDGRE